MSLALKLDRRLSGNAAIKLTAELIGRSATFLLTLLAARRLGEAEFGLYSYGLALGFVLAQVADLGLQVLVTREVAINGRQARAAVQTALRLKLALSALVLVLLALLSAGRPGALGYTFLALGLAMVLQTYLEFAAYVFRGEQRLGEEARLLALARLLAAALGAAVLWLGGGLLGLAVTTLAATGLMVAWAGWRLAREGWLAPAPGAPWRPLLWQAVPLGAATFLSIAFTRLAIFLLDYRLDEVAVGHFSAAQRLVEPAQMAPAAVLAAVFPALAHGLRHDAAGASRLGRQTTLILALLGGAVAAFFWIGAPWLIPWLYGPSFAAGVPALRWLGLSALPAYVNYSLTHLLIARGQQRQMTLLMGGMLVLHALISWRLMPTWGASGPAVSTTVAEAALLAGCLLALRLGPGRVGPAEAATERRATTAA